MIQSEKHRSVTKAQYLDLLKRVEDLEKKAPKKVPAKKDK